jgi:hypothetical protein
LPVPSRLSVARIERSKPVATGLSGGVRIRGGLRHRARRQRGEGERRERSEEDSFLHGVVLLYMNIIPPGKTLRII